MRTRTQLPYPPHRFSKRVRSTAISLSGCGINSVPAAEEEARAQWANVQAAFQRRANLVPNLVATVRGAAASEERILTQVTEARANATRVTITPEQLSDPQAMQRFSEAQSRLSAAILPLQRLQEAYPQLQSQQNFTILMSQLEGTENRINVELRDYTRPCGAITRSSAPSRPWSAQRFSTAPSRWSRTKPPRPARTWLPRLISATGRKRPVGRRRMKRSFLVPLTLRPVVGKT